jgi:hypothetical protein
MRTIQSPGVEIREIDLSQVAFQPTGTNVFLAGFAQRGPTDEVLQITSVQELEQIYGAPVTPAERYFYHSAKQIVTDSNANLYVNRLPYGSGAGYGYGSSFGALVYPLVTLEETDSLVWRASKSIAASAFDFSDSGYDLDQITNIVEPEFSSAQIITLTSSGLSFYNKDLSVLDDFSLYKLKLVVGMFGNPATSVEAVDTITNTFVSGADVSVTNNISVSAGTYVLGAPKFFELTLDQYNSVIEGTGFNWSSTSDALSNINTIADFGKAGLIILNKGQTVTEAQAEGFYAAITDNTNAEPTTDHDSILHAYTVTQAAPSTGLYGDGFTEIPEERLNFSLSGGSDAGISRDDSNISYNLERTFYNFADSTSEKFDDTLSISLYKLRRSIYTPDAIKMDYVLERNHIGSLDFNRKIQDVNGGEAVSYFISAPQKESRNIKIIVNDNITNRGGDTWLDSTGVPRKKVRLYTRSAIKALAGNVATGTRFGGYYHDYVSLSSQLGYVDALYPTGAYTNLNVKTKDIGNLPTKIENALYKVENDELFDLDLVVEGGLGTIYTTCCANQVTYFDDTVVSDNFLTGLSLLKTTGEYQSPVDSSQDLRALYHTIYSKFDTFCSSARKDCMFIADPLRQIFVKGENSKVLPNASNSFSKDIYTALRHLFELANSNYSCTYGNWAKVYDPVAGLNIWIPFSPFAACSFVNTDSNYYPWYAPAGFTRGRVRNVLELAVAPKQKERDQLYKIAVNPVAFFPGDGITIFGQKTMQRQPSAFDRINVRRLFLYLEKATKKTVKYFVFEPNTTFTRTRLVNTLNPIFNFAKSTQGVADYMIVSDKRNNTPDTIDNNELVVDIYIKPVRASEFILVNFIATRTGASFSELISGPRL